MRVDEMDKRACLLAKVLDLLLRQICTQQFNRSRAIEIHLFAEIHIREAPTSQKFFEAVVAYLLTQAVTHHQSPYTQKLEFKSLLWHHAFSRIASMTPL